MTTARIRNYVKKNPEKIERWKNKVLKRYIIRELIKEHGDENTPSEDFNLVALTNHGGQNKICRDILYDHYGLAYGKKTMSKRGFPRETVIVYEDKFEEMTKGKGIAPDFETIDASKKHEDDIYTLLNDLSLPHLIYIYYNRDEFCFMEKTSQGSYSRNYKGLGVFYKDSRDEADNLAFRNAISAYYENKMPLLGTLVCEKDFSLIKEPGWSESGLSPHASYDFSSYINDIIPKKLAHVNSKKVGFSLEAVEHGLQYLNILQHQLKDMKASIEEAGGNDGFQEKFYEKAIANFYKNIPLLINSSDEGLKEMALRAAKKRYT